MMTYETPSEQQARIARERADQAEAKAGVAIARAAAANRLIREAQAAQKIAEEALAHTQQQLEAVLKSTSWSLTAPLRRIVRQYNSALEILRSDADAKRSIELGALPFQEIKVETEGDFLLANEVDFPTLGLDLRAAFLSWYSSTPIVFPYASAPDVSIIIPVYGALAHLETCLRSIIVSGSRSSTIEVILIDDCPNAPVLPLIPESNGLIRLVNTENVGFLRSCNRGAGVARGRLLCFLNSDTIVASGWLDALVNALSEEPRCGLVGGMLLDNSGAVQEAGWWILGDGSGVPIGRGEDPSAHDVRRPVDCVTGACFMIKSELWNQLNGFDERYAPAYYEEFDLAFRARELNLLTFFEPRCRVVHLGAKSYGNAQRDTMSQAHRLIFVDRFAEQLRFHPSTGEEAQAIVR